MNGFMGLPGTAAPASLLLSGAAALPGDLPGAALWQPYLDGAPRTALDFAKDPWAALWGLLPSSPLQLLRDVLQHYAGLLLFLCLLTLAAFLLEGHGDRELLNFTAVCGCGVLAWDPMMTLAGTVCEKMEEWKRFLVNFLPVYGGVLAAGGESCGGAAAGGFLLSGLCVLAQCTAAGIIPLLQSYLAVSMTCCISSQKGLAPLCRTLGGTLRGMLLLIGKILTILLGVQRIMTLQLDRTTLQLGQMLAGSVPIIGQTLSQAADTVLAGFQLLKSSLGIAALLILGAEFVPLYMELMLHLLFLTGCSLLCGLSASEKCRELFLCLAQAVRCMAAVVALFFELVAAGVVLMMAVGGG